MKKVIVAAAAAVALLSGTSAMANELWSKNGCMACHAVDKKLVGPGFAEVAAKYASDKEAPKKLAAKIKAGGSGAWGPVPMPAHPQISEADLASMVKSILAAKK